MALFSDLHTETLYYRAPSGRDTGAGGFSSPTFASAVSFTALIEELDGRQIVEAGLAKGLGYRVGTYTDIPEGSLIFRRGDVGSDTATGRVWQNRRSASDGPLGGSASDVLYEYEV